MMRRDTNRLTRIMTYIRDGLAWSFAWLTICTVMICLIGGTDSISVMFLLKLLALCLWGVISFVISFVSNIIKDKRFICRLTVFYILFIPVEVLMFFLMGIFSSTGNSLEWGIFGAIVVLLYAVCLVIDKCVCDKLGEDYTTKLKKYQEQLD